MTIDDVTADTSTMKSASLHPDADQQLGNQCNHGGSLILKEYSIYAACFIKTAPNSLLRKLTCHVLSSRSIL